MIGRGALFTAPGWREIGLGLFPFFGDSGAERELKPLVEESSAVTTWGAGDGGEHEGVTLVRLAAPCPSVGGHSLAGPCFLRVPAVSAKGCRTASRSVLQNDSNGI